MDELTPYEDEIAREHFPIPDEPVPAGRGVGAGRETGREVAAALHRVDAVVDRMPLRARVALFGATVALLFTTTLDAAYAGVRWEAERQEDRIRAEFARADAEFWALADAYTVAYEGEMLDRGYSEERIERARRASFAELMGRETPDSEELPAPAQADTLEIRRQFSEAEGRWDALFDELNPDR